MLERTVQEYMNSQHYDFRLHVLKIILYFLAHSESLLLFCFCFPETGFLCVALAILELRDPPVSVPQVLGLKECATTTQHIQWVCILKLADKNVEKKRWFSPKHDPGLTKDKALDFDFDQHS